MIIYNNYLRKDPFSPFSQITKEHSFYKKVLHPLLTSFTKPQEGKKVAHSSQEYSMVMLLNALLGYSQNSGPHLLERKLYFLLNGNIEPFIKDTRILPHSSQLNKYVNKFSMEEVDKALLEINRNVLPYLLTKGILPKKLKLAFDFKKQLYYGNKDDPYVIGIKAEKGTKTAYFWHVCSIINKGMEIQVGSQMVDSRTNKTAFIEKMVAYLEELGFVVEFTALDKEYYDKEVMGFLDSKGIVYTIPVRESKKLKGLKEETLKNPKNRVRACQIKGKYKKGQGFLPHRFNIGFFAKKGLRFSALRAKYRKDPGALSEILADIFVLATNQVLHAPRPQKKYRFYKLREVYHPRWRIETANREENSFFISTCSKNPEVRNLYLVLSLALYNLWVITHLFLHKKPHRFAKEPKAFFTAFMSDFALTLLQLFLGHDPPFSEFCREIEINFMRCYLM